LKQLITIILFFTGFGISHAQFFKSQVPEGEKQYDPKKVIDPEYGITMYNKMIQPLGGDSMRYTKQGYNQQGWREDYYTSGKVLHKGYYVDGLIKVFKNYYENGQVERNFTSADPKRSKLEIYYEDGKLKSEVNYFEGNAQKQYDFYPNGNPEYVEENDKDISFLYKRNSYFENGQPSSLFELIDRKEKKYSKKEFYENGKLKEEGSMVLRKSMGDYVKEGEWTTYTDKGDIIKKANFKNGEAQ
jgi:antitoxin component YwqK of YwqJK toxin-antitoxin module